MENDLVLIMPHCAERAKSQRLTEVLQHTLAGSEPVEIIEKASELHPLRGKRVLFAVVLGSSAINLEYYAMLKKIRLTPDMFEGCRGALLVDGMSELYTKSIARELVLAANLAGCAFIGRPLVEGTASLANFQLLAQTHNLDAYGAYLRAAEKLLARLFKTQCAPPPQRNLLVLHASRQDVSNTYYLWSMVKDQLHEIEIQAISLLGSEIIDCCGCSYDACLHFGSQGSCYYGGTISDAVFPALERCSDLLLLCPNYNDALSAHLTAFINRLTALYRQRRFYDKSLRAIIVSGYSGSDIIAGQLIAGLCMNKSFFLPPRFCLMETAYDSGSIGKIAGIQDKAAAFAAAINGF
jgi:hypothetical protein